SITQSKGALKRIWSVRKISGYRLAHSIWKSLLQRAKPFIRRTLTNSTLSNLQPWRKIPALRYNRVGSTKRDDSVSISLLPLKRRCSQQIQLTRKPTLQKYLLLTPNLWLSGQLAQKSNSLLLPVIPLSAYHLSRCRRLSKVFRNKLLRRNRRV